MKAELTQLQRALACLAHASRFRILIELMERPRFVSELAAAVRLSQSCTTRHLQAMSRVGLVRGLRAGRRVFFEVERSTPVLAALAPWTEHAVGGSRQVFRDPPVPAPAAGRDTPSHAKPGPRRKGRHEVSTPVLHSPRQSNAVSPGAKVGSDPPPASAAPRRASHELEDFLL